MSDFTMKIFIEIKKLLRLLGVLEFNHRRSKVIQCFLIMIVCGTIIPFELSTLWFFCFVAATFIEQVECFLGLVGELFIFVMFLMLTRQQKEILDLIIKMETRINKCMSISVIHINLRKIHDYYFRWTIPDGPSI